MQSSTFYTGIHEIGLVLTVKRKIWWNLECLAVLQDNIKISELVSYLEDICLKLEFTTSLFKLFLDYFCLHLSLFICLYVYTFLRYKRNVHFILFVQIGFCCGNRYLKIFIPVIRSNYDTF